MLVHCNAQGNKGEEIFFNYLMLESDYENLHKFELELFSNGDTKHQMIIMWRNGYEKH